MVERDPSAELGEGFDHPPLDTLVLAMPVSWKGTLQKRQRGYKAMGYRIKERPAIDRIVDLTD